MNAYTQKNVDATIFCIANQISKSIAAILAQGNQHQEDFCLELIEEGLILKSHYKEGKRSLRTYLNTALKQKGIDILRKHQAKKRTFIVQVDTEESDFLERHEAQHDDWMEREEIEFKMQQAFSCLSQEEIQFALLLKEISPEQAKRELGWSHGKMRRCLDRLRKKFGKIEF